MLFRSGLVEGPHIYKKNGYYYLIAAEGGTSYEHALTCARSESLFGPYEVHPQNPLISSYSHDELRIQKAGHGSWCESIDNKKTYLTYLCGRPLEGTNNCPLGRETGIAEIIWKDDWPWVIQNDGTLTNTPPDYIEIPEDKDDTEIVNVVNNQVYTFFNYDFLKDFKTLRIPIDKQKYSIEQNKGFLTIRGGESPLSNFEQSILARRQTDFCFEAETKMFFEPDYFQQLAGMTYRYDEETQYLLTITYDEIRQAKVLKVITVMPGSFEQGSEIVLESKKPVWLKLTVWDKIGLFSWSQEVVVWINIRPCLMRVG